MMDYRFLFIRFIVILCFFQMGDFRSFMEETEPTVSLKAKDEVDEKADKEESDSDDEDKSLEGPTDDSSTYKDWTQQDAKVCYKAKGRQSFGTFTLKESGRLKGIMLEHLSGYVTCSTGDIFSRGLWGCRYQNIFTVITKNDNKVVFPPNVIYNSDSLGAGFKLQGVDPQRSNVLAYYYQQESDRQYVSKGNQFRIWFTEALLNKNEYDNGGKHCVKVYAKF